MQKFKEIYIVSPFYNTGGPKSLHQLSEILRKNGYNAKIVYHNDEGIIQCESILYPWMKNVKATCNIIDLDENILIVPETQSGVLKKYKNIKKVIWWLSLDYYFSYKVSERMRREYYCNNKPLIMFPISMLREKKRNWNYTNEPIKSKKQFREIFHLYNCEYVNEYLIKMGVEDKCKLYLCGPLESEILQYSREHILSKKTKVVAYNPAKMNGVFFERVKKKVLSIDSSIQFIKIFDMSREEVIDSLKKASVYVDFGYFPGPERIPREAALMYCNIITAYKGSAKNDIDVQIPSEYKIMIKKKNIKKVSYMIVDMINNYTNYANQFEQYREKVKNQIERFENDCLTFIKRQEKL